MGEYYFREGFSVKAIESQTDTWPHCEARRAPARPLRAHFAAIGSDHTELADKEAVAVYDELAIKKREQGLDKDALVISETIVDLDLNPIAHLRIGDMKLYQASQRSHRALWQSRRTNGARTAR